MSRPGYKATNPLDSSAPTQAYLASLFIDCRLLLLFATTNDSAKLGLYTDRSVLYYCTIVLLHVLYKNSVWHKLHFNPLSPELNPICYLLALL